MTDTRPITVLSFTPHAASEWLFPGYLTLAALCEHLAEVWLIAPDTPLGGLSVETDVPGLYGQVMRAMVARIAKG